MIHDDDISVCILGADERASILETIESVRVFGLPVHVAVNHPRSILDCIEGVTQHRINWVHDFAAARNQLLQHVTSRFVLWLDSDEAMVSFGEFNWQALDGDVYCIKMQVQNGHTPASYPRIHRNIPAIRWIGKIHEWLSFEGRLIGTTPRTIPGIAAIHTGYEDKSVVETKDVRNVSIALRGGALSSMSRGELIAIARSDTTLGRFNVMIWVRLFYHHEQIRTLFQDSRAESALMLLSSGYSSPALELLRSNPLIMPLQLGMLADSVRKTGLIDAKRMAFVVDLLSRNIYDPQHVIPIDLLRSNANGVDTHVRAMADEWMERRRNMDNRLQDVGVANIAYRRTSTFEAETFDDDLILMHSESWEAVVLNAVAAALWEALAWDHTPEQLRQLLAEGLPGESSESIKDQVTELLSKLLAQKLIVPA